MKCSICKDEIEGEGYSTQPFFKDENKKCCEVCSRIFVGPAKRNYKDIEEHDECDCFTCSERAQGDE